mmetsp:Transcript_9594/g.34051  ORF Transcript_9594/g.34051 Transcript_9594/m.34051 type:complete len:347 (-) Transcript_9594:46-1086(-)
MSSPRIRACPARKTAAFKSWASWRVGPLRFGIGSRSSTPRHRCLREAGAPTRSSVAALWSRLTIACSTRRGVSATTSAKSSTVARRQLGIATSSTWRSTWPERKASLRETCMSVRPQRDSWSSWPHWPCSALRLSVSCSRRRFPSSRASSSSKVASARTSSSTSCPCSSRREGGCLSLKALPPELHTKYLQEKLKKELAIRSVQKWWKRVYLQHCLRRLLEKSRKDKSDFLEEKRRIKFMKKGVEQKRFADVPPPCLPGTLPESLLYDTGDPNTFRRMVKARVASAPGEPRVTIEVALGAASELGAELQWRKGEASRTHPSPPYLVKIRRRGLAGMHGLQRGDDLV